MNIITTITDPGHPDFGQTIETDLPDAPSHQRDVARGRATRHANIQARAAALRRKGQHTEALSLLATLEN